MAAGWIRLILHSRRRNSTSPVRALIIGEQHRKHGPYQDDHPQRPRRFWRAGCWRCLTAAPTSNVAPPPWSIDRRAIRTCSMSCQRVARMPCSRYPTSSSSPRGGSAEEAHLCEPRSLIVDRRSFRRFRRSALDQGLDRLAQIHVGCYVGGGRGERAKVELQG